MILRRHSTTTALTKINGDMCMGMKNQQLTDLTLLNFSKAYNGVHFDLLLDLLRSLNISPVVIDWFRITVGSACVKRILYLRGVV